MRRQGGLFLCMLCLNHDNQHQDVDDQGCSRNNRAEQFHALTPFGNPSGEEIFTPVGRTCAVRGATAFEKVCGCVIAGLSPCNHYRRFCAECQFRSNKFYGYPLDKLSNPGYNINTQQGTPTQRLPPQLRMMLKKQNRLLFRGAKGGLFLYVLFMNHDNQHQDVDDQGCS